LKNINASSAHVFSALSWLLELKKPNLTLLTFKKDIL